ncbi:MAG: hypothetical protein OEV94_04805 [Deltaproteobacteria bacterium]|nr:hypothetical protein [Deltaproteobacteria bacterium]
MRLPIRDRAMAKLSFLLSSNRRLALAAAALTAGITVVALLSWAAAPAPIHQPIQFNHQLHTAMLPCAHCHTTVETQENAGRPDISICAGCHAGMDTARPEAQKVRELAEKGITPPWRRLTRVAAHVRFSHMRHVGAAKLDCELCHGDMAQTTTPPPRALKTIDMNFCLNCHESNPRWVNPASQARLQSASKGGKLAAPVAAAMGQLSGKRFFSESHLKQVLAKTMENDPEANPVEQVWDNLDPAPHPSTDCIACHR